MEKRATTRHPPPEEVHGHLHHDDHHHDLDLDDNEALTRARLEERASQRIVEAQVLVEALEVIEAAVAQVGPGSLPVLAERRARAYSRALARMDREMREAVRARAHAVRTEGAAAARRR